MSSQRPNLPGFRELWPQYVVGQPPQQQPPSSQVAAKKTQRQGEGNQPSRDMNSPARAVDTSATARLQTMGYQRPTVPVAPAVQQTASSVPGSSHQSVRQVTPSSSRPQSSPAGRTHTHDERRYLCDICDKRFSRPSALETHKNSHTGEKPYNCDFHGCDKMYSTKSNMRRHSHMHTTPEGTQFPSNPARRN